jgi:general secretion pathway protein K
MKLRPGSGPRGFALVVVLWSLGGLALVGAQITFNARIQSRLAAAARDQVKVEVAADGAVQHAMFMLLGDSRQGSTAQPTKLRIGEAIVTLAAEDEAGKINPNTVSRQVLRRLLAALGVDPPRADRLAGQIADWRSRGETSALGGPKIDQYRDRGLPYRWGGGPFAAVDDVGLVPDMTPEILARLRPWLSIYQEGETIGSGGGSGGDSPAQAAAADARVSNLVGGGPGNTTQNLIMRVTASALMAGRARFVRSAVVRVHASANGTRQVQLLTWE